MNRGVVESSGLNPNWWNMNMNMNMNTSRPPSNHQQQQLPPNNFHPPQIHQYYSSPCNWLPQTDTNNHQDQISAASWTQLFMSGLVGDEDKAMMSHFNDQQQAIEDHVKQENSFSGFVNANIIEDHFLVGSKSNSTNCWSPQSCITTTTTTKTDPPPPAVERSFECNSSVNVNGGPIKKARVQSSSATQSTFKVRKFGDRITSLHQLVSPFGKTDTASVLLEAIGYIRFLESQIEALSIPYMGSGSGNNKKQQLPQSVKGERSCIFPEDPGQLLNDNSLKRKGGPDQELGKDLRSRGLCLVPVSCTLNVGRENGADYWAPVLGGFR